MTKCLEVRGQLLMRVQSSYVAGPSYKRAPPAPPTESNSDDDASSYSSSSTSVIEDEEGDELTPAMDAAILRTLHKIRAKQGVYSGENVLQQELSLAQERAGNLKLGNGNRQPKEKVNRVHDILLHGN